MTTFQISSFWILVFIGTTQGNHAGRTRASGIGRVGNPIFSIDPFALTSLNAMASSASSSSASAASSSGASRSAASSMRGRPHSLTSRIITSSRRRGLPIVARIQGRPMLVVNTGGHVSPRSQLVSRQSRPAVRRIGHRNQISQSALLELLGIAPSTIGSRRTVGLSHQPPGVSYLGQQRLSGHGRQIILPPNVQIIASSAGQSQSPVSQIGLGSLSGGSQLTPVIQRAAPQPPATNTIPGLTGLRIGGVTPKGELIIRGPGGTITIGPELLHGIQSANSFPLFTEFEEMEVEPGVQGTGPNRNRNSLKLTEPGRGSIVIAKAPISSASSSAGSGASGAGSVIQVLSGSQGPGGVVASSSASAGSSSASSQASSSSSSSSASASASVSSATAGAAAKPIIAVGNGITVESGGGVSGRVIRLGDTGAKKQVITMGGSGGPVQLTSGGSGLQVPGNATFIVAR